MVWTDQLVPSQRSASSDGDPVLDTDPDPTAMQELDDGHETLLSAPYRIGAGWIDQLEPSQRSASVRESEPEYQ
jgi:hypothetical protein